MAIPQGEDTVGDAQRIPDASAKDHKKLTVRSYATVEYDARNVGTVSVGQREMLAELAVVALR